MDKEYPKLEPRTVGKLDVKYFSSMVPKESLCHPLPTNSWQIFIKQCARFCVRMKGGPMAPPADDSLPSLPADKEAGAGMRRHSPSHCYLYLRTPKLTNNKADLKYYIIWRNYSDVGRLHSVWET